MARRPSTTHIHARRAASASVVLLGAAAFALPSCREPTQITLALSTDVDCGTVTKNQTDIGIGSRRSLDDGTAQSVVATTCRGKDIGTLTVVPSGTGDSVAIAVALSTKAGKPSSACRSDATDCIVARRVIGFVDHTALTLPIELSLSCLNVSCAVGQTCVKGACASDTVDVTRCNSGVCGSETLPPLDGGVSDASDACAGATCGGTCVDLDTDPKNCGACGFDCSGGECAAGTCRLAPKAQLAEALGDQGCITVLGSANAEFAYWTRTKPPTAVYGSPAKGGPPSPIYSFAPGVLLAGIASRPSKIAFETTNGGNVEDLYLCDPSLSLGLCVKRSVTGAPVAIVASDGEAQRAAYAVAGNDLRSTSAVHDRIGGYGGLVVSSKGHVAAMNGNALQMIELATDTLKSSVVLPGSSFALVGDPDTPRVYVGLATAIQRLDPDGSTSNVTSVAAPARALAFRSLPVPTLFYVVPEVGGDAIYRVPADGSTPGKRVVLVPPNGALACISAGKDSVYWTAGGVAYRHVAP